MSTALLCSLLASIYIAPHIDKKVGLFVGIALLTIAVVFEHWK